MSRPLPLRSSTTFAFITTALAIAACQRADRALPARADVAARPESRAISKVASSITAGAMTATDSAAPAPQASPETPDAGEQSAALPTPSDSVSMIIRNGTASIEVDTLANGIARVRTMAARVGGAVANSATQTGDDQRRSATLEIRIPAARFDEAITGLTPIGTVQSVNVSAQDVGEEYVDVGARMANARRLEARLIALLEARTGKLTDVLAVERELARVREEIERYEGRLRYLRTRTATSTLSISLVEALPVGAAPGEHPLTDAVERAWRNFLGFIALAIASLGWMIPLAVLAMLVTPLVRRMRARRTPPPSAPPANEPPAIDRAA